MIDKSLRYNYQWGGPGGKSPGSSSSGGGGGGPGPGGQGARGQATQNPGRSTPEPDRQDRARQQAAIEQAVREVKPAHLGDTGGSLPTPVTDKGPDHLSHNAPIEYITKKPKIDTGPKRDMHDFEIKKRKTTTITGGNPFLEDPYEKR